jgi:hypothetical protein
MQTDLFVGTLELNRRLIMTIRKRLSDLSNGELTETLDAVRSLSGDPQAEAQLVNDLLGEDLTTEEAYMQANSGMPKSFVDQESSDGTFVDDLLVDGTTHQGSRREHVPSVRVQPASALTLEEASGYLNMRLGDDRAKLTSTQFNELVAMYLAGNSWLTKSHWDIRVVERDGFRSILVSTDDRPEVCPVSWPTTRFDASRWQAKAELARQDANYRPRGYETDVTKTRLDIIQAELKSELADDYWTDTSDFQLDPCYGRPLPFPVVRTYDMRVLNFNGPMVAAVRQQHEGVMPRYAGVLLHPSKPQLAVRFSITYVPGYHLVSPESDYNSYRVHAGSSVVRVYHQLGTHAESEVNGRRRCHQVGNLWVVDYSEDKV